MEQAIGSIYLGTDSNENGCSNFVWVVSMAKTFWRMGTWMDHGKLQDSSDICYVNVKNNFSEYYCSVMPLMILKLYMLIDFL